MTIEKLFPSGMYCVSDVIDNQLIVRRYSGYTKREAITLFRQEIRAQEDASGKEPTI